MTTQTYKIKAKVEGKRDIKGLQKALGNTQTKLMSMSKAATLAGVALAAIGTYKFIKGLVQVGKEVEGLQLRFKFLFGSAKEGAKAFQTLTDFAATVPFSLQDIAMASGNLAIVSEDAEQLNENLKLTANIAAVAGLDFRQTGEQLQRAFSTGAAAADIFRERGVLALLGFEQGAKITLEETKKRFKAVFGEGGEFGTAAQEFAGTLEGTLSMLGDKFFKFQTGVNEHFFEALKKELGDLNIFFDDNQEGIDAFAKQVGEALAGAVVNASKAIIFLKDNVGLLKIAFGGLAIIAVANGFIGLANTLNSMIAIVRALTAVMLKNPLFILLAGAALTALYIFRDEIGGLIDDIIGTHEPLTKLEYLQDNYTDAIGRTLVVMEANKKANKEKIAAVKDELKVLNAWKKANQSKLDQIRLIGETELEQIARVQKERLDILDGALKSGAILEKEFGELRVKIEEDVAAKKKAIADKALQEEIKRQEARISAIKDGRYKDLDLTGATEKEKRDITIEAAGEALKGIAQHNKKAFELNKAVAITEAIINTYQGATKALAQGGVFGPFLAAAIVASGLAQVATIRNQQYPGREQGGPVMAGKPYVIGEAGPEIMVPGRSGTVIPNEQTSDGKIVNISFTINAVDTRDFDKLIRSRQGVFLGMINQALNEQGRRALV